MFEGVEDCRDVVLTPFQRRQLFVAMLFVSVRMRVTHEAFATTRKPAHPFRSAVRTGGRYAYHSDRSAEWDAKACVVLIASDRLRMLPGMSHGSAQRESRIEPTIQLRCRQCSQPFSLVYYDACS